eukprot:2811741-Amphidinium_carterae.1
MSCSHVAPTTHSHTHRICDVQSNLATTTLEAWQIQIPDDQAFLSVASATTIQYNTTEKNNTVQTKNITV